jgi:hydrogenase maturation protease
MIEGGTLGLNLLPALQGVTHLLALDAVDTGNPPGSLSRFVNAGLDALPVARSVHLLGFADLLNSLRLLGQAPAEVALLGIQPESTGWGVTLSPLVTASLDRFIDAALVQILDWGNTTDLYQGSQSPGNHLWRGLHISHHETERVDQAKANAPEVHKFLPGL